MHLRATLSLMLFLACKNPTPQAPAQRSCLDAQLEAKGLNPYGDPPDTAYAGGTPLFDEKTGKSTAREAYVFARHPEIARACDAGP